MKKKHLACLSFCLSLLLLCTALAPAGWGNRSIAGILPIDGTDKAMLATQSLAASANDFITGNATHTFDLSRSGQVTFSEPMNISYAYNSNGYYTFTGTTDDPYIYLAKNVSFSAARYILVTYRASGITDCTLQIYIASSGGGPQNDTTMVEEPLTADGTWRVLALDTSTIPSALFNGTSATYLRLDPIDGGNAKGKSIDISSVALYSASAFDYAGYQAYLEGATGQVAWDDPTYVAQSTVAADYNTGSLTYTPSADRESMTISYDLNGSTVSNTVPNKNNYLFGGYTGTDDLGRELYTSEDVGIYGSTGEHYVGLFYFLWHGQHGATDKIYDLQKIIDSGKGTDASQYAAAGSGVLHWFAEPLYGYYISGDQWVMRKHAELLCNANIDFLYLDATNGFTYTSQALALMSILHELNEQGYDAPQVVFYTNSASNTTAVNIYNEIYALGYYPDTWFRINGKPVMVATESSDGIRTSGSIPATLHNFFYFKESQWPNEAAKTNGWPWMDWSTSAQSVYAATDGKEAINVSVAQHNANICFSSSAMHGYAYNQGRSYAPGKYASMTNYRNTWQNNQDLTKWGYNFQWQWDTAINSGAEFVLVTGWNEWVAQRQSASLFGNAYSIVFIDCASMEFSRDTEMMAFYDRNGDGKDDGYFDNYYMQLTQNVEKLKGDAPIIVQDTRKPINVTAGFDQWDDIEVTYTDAKGDTVNRNAVGYGNVLYTNTTGRNDILAAKVTSDSKNVYFYAQTRYHVSMYDTESSWMQLFVDADNNAQTGWYGYDYIVNYRAQSQFTTTVAKYTGSNNSFSFTTVGTVSYRAKDNEIMISVPQAMLGMDGYLELDFNFKWADSTSNITTMQQFYTDGDVAPLGRLNFVYQNYIPGKSVVTYPSEVPPAELSGASVSLGEALSIQVYATLPSEAGAGQTWGVSLLMNGALTTIPWSDATVADADADLYAFTFDGITPQCMGDSMTISLRTLNTQTQAFVGEPVDVIEDYSIRTNLISLLQTYAAQPTLVQLVYDTLQYGASAQVYTNYRTDAPVNAGLEALMDTAVGTTWTSSSVTPSAKDNVQSLTASTLDNTCFHAATVQFNQGYNQLAFAYQTDTPSAVTITINGATVTPTESDGWYMVFSNSISALAYDKTFTVCLYVGGHLVQSVNYSINTYAYNMYTKYGTTTAGASMALALYRYGVASEAYAAAHGSAS